MTGKSQALYEELFRAVDNKCAQLGFQLDPSVIISDFQQAVISAVRNVFSTHVRSRCCFYHLTQCTWRRIQHSGLATAYKTNAELRHFCGMIDSPAFLPLSDVPKGMAYLHTIVPTEAYPPALWNVNEATLAATTRTNNVCESWNNGYRTHVGHANPCVYGRPLTQLR